MAPSRSPWRLVDWFIAPEIRIIESERLQRTRLLVVSILLVIPLTLFGAVELLRAGTLVSAQALMMGVSTLALVACLLALKFSRSHVPAGVGFCLYLVWGVFFLSGTDYGIRDPMMAWGIPIPMIAAFVVGPWLAALCALILLSGVGLLYYLELGGHLTLAFLSTPEQLHWFTLLALGTAITFSAILGWVYEGYTVRRLRRVNLELRRLRAELEESEQRYRALFDNIPVGVYQSTPEGRITMANRALLDMLGVPTVAALERLDAFSLYESPDRRTEHLLRLDAEGEVHGTELTLIPDASSRLRVRETARVARDEDGRVLYYEGVLEDVTAQREAEHTVRQVEERYRLLVQNSSDTITIVDEHGTIRYMSPSVTPNLGYQPEEVLGLNVLDLVDPADRRRMDVLFRRALSSGGDFGTVEFQCRHVDGHFVYVEAVGANMLDNPWVRGIVLNSRDVTDRKRAEVALVRAKEQAEEVARLKSAFLANMSHEIRTPLTGIIGFAGVLAEEVDAEHREFVTLIERSGRRLLQTLNSVLDLARLESNQMEVELRSVDVVEQVEDVVALLQPIARDRGVSLRVQSDGQQPIVRLDVACLNRILNNLVGNALKFTDDGEVCVSVRTLDGDVEIAVRDTGIGIDAAFLPHLFDEFKQESSGLGRRHEGSGLGLNITRRLVELMNGQISVASTKGAGSTFKVTFPKPFPDATVQEPRQVPGIRPRVLVVDDNESTLALMARMLRDVAVADVLTTSEEALRAAGERQYDVIFLDIHLAGSVSGTEVMRALRQSPAHASAFIVAFTAFALPGDRERFLNAGFDAYLGKPFSRAELDSIFDTAVASRLARGDGASAGASADIVYLEV